jgi:hypothetical protein
MFTPIVHDLKELLSTEAVLDENRKLESIIQEYNKLKNESNDKEDANRLLANDLINKLKEKHQKEKELKKKNSNAVREKKEVLIQEIDELIKNEQNIGKAFSGLNKIRESWIKTSGKDTLEQKDIDRKFTKKIEDFYYNINIYRAIQDHDLKRNQQLKEAILEKLKIAISNEATNNLSQETRLLRTEWESIGPVSKELQNDFWLRYRDSLDKLYSKLKDFKNSQKQIQINNEIKKTEIINYITKIKFSEIESLKEWKQVSKEVLEKQEEWKSIGFVPKESKDKIWISYREACDLFFGAKKSFFDQQKKLFKANKALKNELCKKAEELLATNNSHELTKEFVNLQSKWKLIGPVHQRDEQYLWHKFKKTCNTFFENKKDFIKQQDALKDSLNEEKENIINELKKASVESEGELLSHLSIWWKTNRDHTRKSNELENKFQKILQSKLVNKTTQEFQNENIHQKIRIYKEFNDDGFMLSKEKLVIKEKIHNLQKDISQYENNLSFFGNSKGSNELMKDVYLKMDNLKSEIIDLKSQLKLIQSPS